MPNEKLKKFVKKRFNYKLINIDGEIITADIFFLARDVTLDHIMGENIFPKTLQNQLKWFRSLEKMIGAELRNETSSDRKKELVVALQETKNLIKVLTKYHNSRRPVD